MRLYLVVNTCVLNCYEYLNACISNIYLFAESVSSSFLDQIEECVSCASPVHIDKRSGGRIEYYYGHSLLRDYFSIFDAEFLEKTGLRYAYASIVEALPHAKDQKVHRDDGIQGSGARLCITLIILLEDVTPENGPTAFYNLPLGERIVSAYTGSIETCYCAIGNRGDAFMYTSETYHRGNANRSEKPRRVLFVNFEPIDYIASYMMNRESKGLKIQHGFYITHPDDAQASEGDSKRRRSARLCTTMKRTKTDVYESKPAIK